MKSPRKVFGSPVYHFKEDGGKPERHSFYQRGFIKASFTWHAAHGRQMV
jgi:hypothetical protein